MGGFTQLLFPGRLLHASAETLQKVDADPLTSTARSRTQSTVRRGSTDIQPATKRHAVVFWCQGPTQHIHGHLVNTFAVGVDDLRHCAPVFIGGRVPTVLKRVRLTGLGVRVVVGTHRSHLCI